jgi:hypothetical protein
MTTTHDLCLLWNWEHDVGFVDLLARACIHAGVSLLQVTPGNLAQIVGGLRAGELRFRTLLDRSSEEDPRFLAVVEWARDNGARSINEHEAARISWNKADMHRRIFAQVHTPYTIILPPYRQAPELPEVDLSLVGESFTIKPGNGGGGAGVMVAAATLDHVRQVRQEYPDDEYLLQTRVLPARLGDRPGWFRVLYCCGEVYPCWWATESHVYAPVSLAQEAHYRLDALRTLTCSVARLCRLELFSSEIAVSENGQALVIDYANDPIDLRLQSRCHEGVPDELVRFIAENLARAARSA